MDSIFKALNSTETLRNNLDKFIEAFVEFYGEDSRSEIEEKFSRMLPIGYITPEELSRNLSDLEKIFTDNAIQSILLNKKISLKKSDLIKNNTFENKTLQPIYKYQQFYEAYCMDSEERKRKFYEKGYTIIHSYISSLTKEEFYEIIEKKQIPEKYQNIHQIIKDTLMSFANEDSYNQEYQELYEDAEPLLKTLIPEITFSNFQEYLNDERILELNKVLEEYKKAIDNYNAFKEKLKKYYDKDKLNTDMKHALQEKYYKKIIIGSKHLIPDDKRTNLEEYLRGEKKDYDLDDYVKYLFGYSINSSLPLEYFSTESENKLTSENISDTTKNEIIKERIEYFRKNGIDLGDDYQVYLESPAVQEIWPSHELADSFIAYRDKCLNDFNNEFYTTTPDHQQIRSKIDSLNLLNKDDGFDAAIYLTKKIFVAPNVRKNNNMYELFPLLIVTYSDYNEADYKDHYTVHELNHVYELFLNLVGEKEYNITCGWDIFTIKVKDTIEDVDTLNLEEDKRPYELFNEIINELIAQEITKIMHKNNVHIFDNPKKSKYRYATGYEHSLFLVRDFFNEFKDKIIASRKDGQIHIIWDEVGKENFDELNSLFAIYFENFGGFKIYNLFSELKDDKDTERTRIYYDLIARKDKILEKMHTHQANKKEGNYERQVTI